MQQPEIKERWFASGADPVFSTSPGEFSALMRSETAKWAKLVGQGQIKVE